MSKRIIISTTNDIATDNRVNKVALLLLSLGYQVHWIGRLLPGSSDLNLPYETSRMRLFFKSGGLFYAEFQIRLFFKLLTNRPEMLLSNDLDTLLPNFLIARLLRIPLVYDSHEYFCGVPEIQGRWVKKIWLGLERYIFPRLEHVWTVNESIAQLYESDYAKRPRVFRNISPVPSVEKVSRASLGLSEKGFIAINQGSGMNVDRGLEEALEAISRMPDWSLLLVGSGDAIPALKLKAKEKGWSDKVIFVDRVPYATLLQYTRCADVGLSLDKDTNINYRFSLPNKIFDYLHSDLPVVTSQVVEVAKIVEEFGIGLTVNPEDIDALRNTIATVGASKKSYRVALEKAQNSLTWEKEQVPLRAFYAQFL